MRVFLAVQLPLELRAKLAALQGKLRSLPVEATWVRDAGFHVTLKFLGEVAPGQIEPIVFCMRASAQRFQPFPLTLQGVGVFPTASTPRVLWVGLQDGVGRLKRLQQTLDQQLAQLGYPLESRPFTPHLTLARLRRVPDRDEFWNQLTMHQQFMGGELAVRSIALMESQLYPSGARYTTVQVTPLGEGAENV